MNVQIAEKLDLKKKYKHLYAPCAKEVEVVDVPELLFIMVDGVVEEGEGPSDSEDFRDSMGALYGVGYGLKFMSKLRDTNPIDFTVMASEGLWTPETGELTFSTGTRMRYTLLMLQPDHITREMFEAAVAQAESNQANPALGRMRLERWREGRCIQIMHVGPYNEEPRSIARLEAFAEQQGLRLDGPHHEIYLGDPRRAKPENLKTILRYPTAS